MNIIGWGGRKASIGVALLSETKRSDMILYLEMDGGGGGDDC